MLLEKPQEAMRLKAALKEKVEGNKGTSGYQAKFYYYSLLAFEARSQKDNETALKWIDSTYQYSPGGWKNHASYLDKHFMLADIYEEQGEYAKAIPYMEIIPFCETLLSPEAMRTIASPNFMNSMAILIRLSPNAIYS